MTGNATANATGVIQTLVTTVTAIGLSNLLAILGIVIGAVLAVFIPVIISLNGRRRRHKASFEIVWRRSSSLKPQEIMRDRPHKEFYFSRAEDELISNALADKKNVLIIGRPLSGKTRAAYQALIAQKRPYDVIIPRLENIDLEKYSLPAHFCFWRPKLIFIDDLHRFVEQQNFQYLFEIADRKKITIVSTCRSEDEHRKVESKMQAAKNTSLTTIFGNSMFTMPDITEGTARQVAEESRHEWSQVRFDGTIGSVFMRLSEMEERFKKCGSEE